MSAWVRTFLYWLPPAALVVVAAAVPDTFLDGPGATVPGSAAHVVRILLIGAAVAYLTVAAVLRVGRSLRAGDPTEPRGFAPTVHPTVTPPTDDRSRAARK